MSLPEFKLLRPRTIEEAVVHLARHGKTIRILAGGTDLLPSMRQRLFTPEFALDISRIDELKKIRMVPGHGVEIGALTTLSAIEDSQSLHRNYPVLCEAAAAVASPILRNMGTLGGNICLDTRCLWYNQSLAWRKSCNFCLKKDGDICHVAPGGKKCWAAFSADTPAALLCLKAELEIASPTGYRRMPLAKFYTDAGDGYNVLRRDELLTRILLPESSVGYRGVYRKLRIRGSIDYPLAGVAVAVKMKGRVIEDASVAITAVNPAPHLVQGADHALIGRAISEHTASVVAELACKIARPLSTSALTPEYRREMIRVFTKRAVLAAGNTGN